MGRVYISFEELGRYGMLDACQAALAAAGKKYFWDADLIIDDLVVDKGWCYEAAWGECVSGGVSFFMPPDFPALMSAFFDSLPDAPKLEPADCAKCEAWCCYDGVYLQPGDEPRIAEAMRAVPELFAALPEPRLIDETWQNIHWRKTAARGVFPQWRRDRTGCWCAA